MSDFVLISIPEATLSHIVERAVLKALEGHSPPHSANEPEGYGGVSLAMEVTGLKKLSIYGLVHKGQIPHYKRGQRLYFKRTELLDWLADGKRKTQQEIEADAETYVKHNTRTRKGRLR
jgi:excisionase family DNA binding protein